MAEDGHAALRHAPIPLDRDRSWCALTRQFAGSLDEVTSNASGGIVASHSGDGKVELQENLGRGHRGGRVPYLRPGGEMAGADGRGYFGCEAERGC
jgi:hypothetical protein